jgi:hypothetical protein
LDLRADMDTRFNLSTDVSSVTTLTEEADMKTTWRKIVTKIPGRRVQGPGYDVELFSPNGIRYRDGAHAVTLWSEILKGVPDENGKRSFWIFDYVRGVYLPTTLRWDDGTALDPGEYERALVGI